MHPWLDELSEDWPSSPSASLQNVTNLSNVSRKGSQAQYNNTTSRIPHLAANIRKTSSSFLRHRSHRRSASSPLSDSQTSVQHHSIRNQENATPEWKKRVLQNEDLFSPSKLETLFKPDPAPVEPASATKLEIHEENEEDDLNYSLSAISPDVIGSIVAQRVKAIETDDENAIPINYDGAADQSFEHSDLSLKMDQSSLPPDLSCGTLEPASRNASSSSLVNKSRLPLKAMDHNPSRKPSLGTKDYMEEANKVMAMIRAKSGYQSTRREPDIEELSEHESTVSMPEPFDRPPSREHRPAPQRTRISKHDTQTASYLRKFQEPDDLDIITSTSFIGFLADNKAAEQAAAVPLPDDDDSAQLPLPDESDLVENELTVEIHDILDELLPQESSPVGIRILSHPLNDRKRKHSSSSVGIQLSPHASTNSTKHSVPSMNSAGSQQKGVIASGTVSIPDTVGTMTFDYEKQAWVKKQLKQDKLAKIPSPAVRSVKHAPSETDPFEDIPDLSIDEHREYMLRKQPGTEETREKVEGLREQNSKFKKPKLVEQPHPQKNQDNERPSSSDKTLVDSTTNEPKKTHTPIKSSLKSLKRRLEESPRRSTSEESKVSGHEERLMKGLPSRDIPPPRVGPQQPRVVTIAFSSPVAHEIPYQPPASISSIELEEDDPSLLPLDDEGSVLASSPVRPYEEPEEQHHVSEQPFRAIMGSLERHEAYRAMTLTRRPISRIDESDEDENHNTELSLVHVKHNELTPMPAKDRTIIQYPSKHESSILCLTPLSEFTLHQVDKINHPEESFIGERANPKTLRQAHGSHALIEDALVKAITDAAPDQLFWEEIDSLSLRSCTLTGLHGLKEYCPALEVLDACDNRIMQLTDLPSGLRTLNISNNMINDLSSWSQWHDLQVVDVSNNHLESLECFNGLIHLRKLTARHNKLRNIDGVMELDGLISLDVSGNDVAELDFAGCNMTGLEYLNASNNNMMVVKNLHCLPHLVTADLSQNVLAEFEVASERQLTKLESLNLSQNELDKIDINPMVSVRCLVLDDNAITALWGLSDSKTLETLSIRAQRTEADITNMILTAPTERLSELYLSHNALPNGRLSSPSEPNYNLRCLELAACGIKELPTCFGQFFPNMRVLNLNFNALTELQPLAGMLKVRHVFCARNRIARMRRTCLSLNSKRLPALRKVDLRENPLTVGFYAPTSPQDGIDNDKIESGMYKLPSRADDANTKWTTEGGLLDEETWMRRRAMEMLLTEHCAALEEFNGAKLDRRFNQRTWDRLTGKGVLTKNSTEEGARSATQSPVKA